MIMALVVVEVLAVIAFSGAVMISCAGYVCYLPSGSRPLNRKPHILTLTWPLNASAAANPATASHTYASQKKLSEHVYMCMPISACL